MTKSVNINGVFQEGLRGDFPGLLKSSLAPAPPILPSQHFFHQISGPPSTVVRFQVTLPLWCPVLSFNVLVII